jgi:SAM-dependent methyltransferase
MARRGARVIGLDRSVELMLEARRLAVELASAPRFVRALAESLPFAEGAFELVAAGQCWHWFDAPAVAAETARVLRLGGRALLCSYDWVPLPGSVVAATEALILRHNPAWSLGGGDGRHPEYARALAAGGFVEVSSGELDADAIYSHAGWRGRIRASAGVGASLPPQGVRELDEEHGRMLAQRFAAEPLRVPHRVYWALGRRAG